MRHPMNCHFMHDIDLFGKNPELYYKGKNKKSVLIGRIFTVLYVLIYLNFFIYKLIRMIFKVDVTFYQTNEFRGEVPSIHLTRDIFYGGFALASGTTLQPFIDESIYYIDLQFRTGERVNNMWNWKVERIDSEICNLTKFVPKYYDLFKDKPMNKMYCPKDIDVILQGHTTYDIYSYFYVGFYPCVNTTTRQNCKPQEEIDKYLKNCYVSFKMQDIELTPQIYASPVKLRAKEVNSPAAKNLFQNINAYFQIVELETDNDVVGFEALANIKKEHYLKYDVPIVLSRLNDNYSEYHAGQPLCDVTVSLKEQVLTIKRSYKKLIEVLGDVGGLMEVVFMIFKATSSFVTDLLYEKSLVNNLFEFDLDKRSILIKELKKGKKIKYKEDSKEEKEKETLSDFMLYSPAKSSGTKISKRNIVYKNNDLNTQTENRLNDEELISNTKLKNEIPLTKNSPTKRKKKKVKKSRFEKPGNEMKPKIMTKNEKDKDNIYQVKDINDLDVINTDDIRKQETENNYRISETKTKNQNRNKEKRNKINKIPINKCVVCICFLFIKRIKTYQNILIDEGMDIITEHLDIFNIFKKLYRDGKIQEKWKSEKDDTIKMSEECIKKLKSKNM